MHRGAALGIFVAFYVANLLTYLLLRMSVVRSKGAEDNARERRMAEHRMNARLLRLNI
jgi:hypothetical protein